MKTDHTNRGFGYIEFMDAYDCECSLQQSSLVEPHIWLGMQKNDDGEWTVGKMMPSGKHTGTRMHLSRFQVKTLLPLLQHFVEHGDLPDEYEGDLSQRWETDPDDEEWDDEE